MPTVSKLLPNETDGTHTVSKILSSGSGGLPALLADSVVAVAARVCPNQAAVGATMKRWIRFGALSLANVLQARVAACS